MRMLSLGAALVASLALSGAATAAVDPLAALMQQTIKKALQANLTKQAPGMKVTTLKCTVSKDARRGVCRANFTYKTIYGYYMLKVVQPLKGKPSYASTSVRCFVQATDKPVAC